MFLLMLKHGPFSLHPRKGNSLPRTNMNWPQNPRDLAEYWLYENELSDDPCTEIRAALSYKIREIDNAC